MKPRRVGWITRTKYLVLLVTGAFVLNYFGAFSHVFEVDFYRDFHYPVEGDVPRYADQLRHGQAPDVQPINYYNYSLVHNPSQACKDSEFLLSPKLVFIVKSAMSHFKQRNAIRSSWGHERRFSDVIIRTVFLLGVSEDKNLQSLIDIEAGNYKDIIQSNFIDTYFNNTIKTMTGFRWAVEHCPRSRFYAFVDDDYYVSAKNVLRFIRNPVNYPEYLEDADETIRQLARKLNGDKPNNTVIDLEEIQSVLEKHDGAGSHSVDSKRNLEIIRSKFTDLRKESRNEIKNEIKREAVDLEKVHQRQKRHLLEMELPLDVKLYSGFLTNSAPHRHKTSKWHVSLDEYPYHMWPPYITAGAYILSKEALIQMYYTSFFTKHFRFEF